MLYNLNLSFLNCKLEVTQLTSCLHMYELNAQCLVSSRHAIMLATIASQKGFREQALEKWVKTSGKELWLSYQSEKYNVVANWLKPGGRQQC